MSKKIFMLLFLMTVLISVSAVSAADADGNNDTIVSSSDAEILSAANDVNAIDNLNGNYSDSDKTALANFIAVGKNNENNILSTDNNVLKNENDGGILKETSATWYVDENAAAGGDGKSKATAFQNLEDALNDANNGDTIRIASGTYTGNKNIGLTIDKNLYFEKYGDDEAIFDAQKQNRIWTVTATTININGLTFKNGKSNSDSGGALKFENALSDSCINAIFINNTVGSYNGGGALFFDKALSNSIINSTFISNSAPTQGWGGAIYSNILKNVKIYGEFINNTAYYGGAIYTWGDLHNSVLNATFINNSASGNGGAFYSNSNFVNFTISSVFINNKASYGGAFRFGGSNVTIENSVFVNNTATIEGGAIYISKSGISFNDNWWGSNNPDWNSLINDGLQPSSYAVLIGSADSTIINQLSESRLKYAFYRNGTDTLISLPKRPIELSATGGQLENTSGYVSNVFSTKFSSEIYGYYNITATVDNQEIKITVREINIWHVDENAAPGGNGRSKATAFQTLKDALDVAKDDDKIMIASGTYTGTNNTGLTIDKILSFEKYGDDQAIFDAQNQNRIWYVTAANTNINGFTFKNGKTGEKAAALYLAGSGNITNCNFTKNTAYGYAGAICFSESGTVEKCNFTNNQANSGGAIFFYKPNSHVTDCNFIENHAVRGTSNGGAIYFSEYGTVTNCNFISNNGSSTSFDNSAYGGAIYFKKSGNVANCNFTNNTLNGVNIGGGAIYFGNGDETCDVTNCNFISNQVHAADVRPSSVSAGYGGAIFCNGDESIFNAINCTFIDNRIDYGPGSAIYCKNCWWCTVEYCIFISNFASYGAAIGSNYQCDYLDVKYSIFLNNQATSGVHDIDWDLDSDHSSVNGYSWFGNNANNKDEEPSEVNVHRLGRWLYLTATADKVMDSYDVKFTLIAIEGSYFDINLMPKVDLTITSTGGSVDKSIAHYDETIKFIPTEGGTGHVTAETNGASYTIDFKTGDFELLQAAINRAPENSVINLTRNYTYNEFDSITSGVLIDKNLTINGNGFTIDAMGKSRIFNVTVGSVTLINLTLKNGAAEDGGAVYFSSTGSVIDCNFTGNKATGQFGKGGAVYFYGEGSVTNCNFSYNAGSLGGAVYFRDYDTLTNCNFTNNTASSNGGAVYFNRMATVTSCNFESNNAADGGAVYFIARSTVSNCNFTNNRATDSSSNGGAIYSNSGDLTLTNCNFTDNTATKYGGAVYSWSYSYATNCNFTNNTATDGGAVYAKNGDSLTKCNFNDNQATNYGGAVYFDDMGTMTSCNFTNNTAIDGAAVYAKDGGSLTKCNFNDNQATEYGGAVYFDDSGTVTSCNFTNNTATDGGAVYFKGSGTVTSCNFTDNTATEYGGAVYNTGNDVTFTNCIFAKNMVTVEFSRGGAVYNAGNDVTFTDCSFDHNNADNGDGGAIYNDGDYGTVNNCRFIGNTVTLSGGAIVNNGWNLSITGCIFDYNFVANIFSDNSTGGAIEIMKSCTIRDSTFTRNVAVYGGALNFDDLKDSRVVALEIYNCSFIFNRALKDGGAIYIKNADNFISKYCIFLSNRASVGGRVINNAIYNKADGILKCLEYNWFGNNADNYNITPTDIVGIDLNNWLYLNATADNVIGSFDVEFILMSNDSESVDNNLLPKVDLSITSTGGSVDKRIAHFNETIKFVPIEVGTGSVTAKIEDVSQTITFDVLLIDTSVNVNNDTLNLVVDDTFTVVANTTPEGLNVTYSSNDNSVVTVDDKGNVIAVGVGNATITVKVGGYGIYAENSTDIEVKVLNDASVVAEDMVLKVGENGTISYSTSPSGLNVSFVPDDSGIVSVSDKGVVTALKNGTAAVTVYVGGDGVYALNSTTVTVSVTKVPTEIIIANDIIRLNVDDEVTAGASLTPADAGNLTFTSSNSSVAYVENGLIIANRSGNAVITVSFAGDDKYAAAKNKTIDVSVGLAPASVSASDITLNVNSTEVINLITNPVGLEVEYLSADPSIAEVDANGVVTSHKGGNTTVTITTKADGKHIINSTTINVTVNKLASEISIADSEITLNVNGNQTSGAFLIPASGVLSYVSSNSTVASVEDGIIFAKAEGTAVITVSYAGDDYYKAAEDKTIAVTVMLNDAKVTAENIAINVNENVSIGAVTTPDNLKLTYVSANSTVAEVDASGKVTGKAKGSTTITITIDGEGIYYNNKTTIDVTVNLNDANVSADPVEVYVGDNYTIVPTTSPAGLEVTYSSLNSSIATVDATGNVIGVSEGVTNITLTVGDDIVYAKYCVNVTVTVSKVPTSIDVASTTVSLKAGENQSVGATLNPFEAGKLTYVSSNSTIAYVEDGLIIANSSGYASITVSFAGDSKYAACENKIIHVSVDLVPACVSASDITLNVNSTEVISITTTPVGLEVEYVSADPSIAEVDAYGVVTSHKGGNTTVTITTKADGKHIINSTTINVTVNKLASEISIAETEITLNVNGNQTSGAFLLPASGVLSYVSSNDTVASVEDGIIFAKAEGTALITVSYAGDDYYKTAENKTITVVVKLNDASVSVNNSTLDLLIDDTFTIVATTTPEGLNVSFVPDDSGVYTVDENGNVTALREGTGHILVKVGGDGVYAENTTEITVIVSKIPTEITVDTTPLDLFVGDEIVIVANLTPAGAGNVTFTSSDYDVVDFDFEGNVIAQGKGQAIITVSFAGDDKYAAAENKTIIINVSLDNASVTVDNNTLDLKVGETSAINATKHPDTIMLDITYTSSNNSVATVDGKGIVTAVGEGTAIITVEVGDDEIYAKNSTNVTVTVSKVPTEIDAKSITATYNINRDLVITLKDADGNPLAGVEISVDLNGAKTYTTDTNGQAKVSTGGLAPKTYAAKITFAGNENYLGSSADVKITIKKATPKITAKKKTYKKSKKTKKYTITLKDSTGKAIKNAKLTLKIAKKTYKAKTNKKGKATFKIKKLNKKGKYKAVIKYAGNKYYNKATKKVKITIK